MATRPVGPRVVLQPAARRAYHGRPVVVRHQLTDAQTAELGEAIVQEYYRNLLPPGTPVARAGRGHYAIDLVAGPHAVETKAGTVRNLSGAQHWRLTIGEPSASERAWLASATADDKRAHNDEKRARIFDRKAAAIRELERQFCCTLTPTTTTVILHPDLQLVDVFTFPGFHARIAWDSPEAARGFVGSYHYRLV